MTRKEVVDCIVNTEFTEWNNIFVHIVKSLQETTTMFQHVAATIEEHKRKAERFLDELPDELKVPDDNWKFPVIWDRKILIVENDTAVQELLSDVLKSVA